MGNLYQRRLEEVKGNVVQSRFVCSSAINDIHILASVFILKSGETPLFGRIVAIADFYDAL